MLHIIDEPIYDANLCFLTPLKITPSAPSPPLFSVYLPHAVRVIFFWPCFPHLFAVEVNFVIPVVITNITRR